MYPSFPWDCQSLLNQSENFPKVKDHLIGDLSISKPSYRWRKKLQMLLYLLIITPRSKLLCIQMPAWKVLVLVYYMMQTSVFCQEALTNAQKGYVVTELESLAVAWAMEKFHHFLYASHFLLETDQKLFEAILSKSLNQATLRLQQILIRTFAYHFTVKYIPGSTNQLANCLSWLGGQKDTIKLPRLHSHQITSQLSARRDSLNQMRIATQEDDELAIF